jgi:recombination associated protein RdgC
VPILRGAIGFARFRARWTSERPKDMKRWLARGLRARAFEPINRTGEDDRSAGWVELEDSAQTELAPASFLFGEYVLAGWRIDKLRVPAAALKSELESWSREFQKGKGRPPSKAERSEQRETVVHRLRARVIPSSRVYDMSWNLKTDRIQIWAASRAIVEEVESTLETSFDLELDALTPHGTADILGYGAAALQPTAELLGGALDA